jgi:maleylpyruvate isomerase
MRVRERVAASGGDAAAKEWIGHWTTEGQHALEGWLARWAGRHCVGDTPTLADFFVVPAVFTMVRLGFPPVAGSRLAKVYAEGLGLPGFRRIVEAGGRPV